MSWPSRADRIDHASHKHVWEQVADDIRADIQSGELPPGARLPSQYDLADIYGVARVTIQRALLELGRDGQVVVAFGRGTFVSPAR